MVRATCASIIDGIAATARFLSALTEICGDDGVVDVEIRSPPDFLAKSSTNALDRAHREGRTVI